MNRKKKKKSAHRDPKEKIIEGLKVRLIPLNTICDYFCSECGKIFRGEEQMKGWSHYNKKFQKSYWRFRLRMKNGYCKFFYGHRLVAITYLGLDNDSGLIVRHRTFDTFNNHKDALLIGTHYDNQVTDRKEDGNYFNRGGKKKIETEEFEPVEDDLPF